MHGVPCSSATTKVGERVSPRVGFVHRSLLADAKALEDLSSHIVGPVIARDTQVLDQYLPQSTTAGVGAASGTGSHIPAHRLNSSGSGGGRDPQKAIYHVPIPPRRPSPVDCNCARNMPAELAAQVDPFIDDLLAHYYDNIHPCYPVTEEEFVLSRIKDRNTPSSKTTSASSVSPRTLFVNLVAYALFYWDPPSSAPSSSASTSPSYSTARRPDLDFAWQAVVAANAADQQKVDLGTIVSICTNVAGRPSRCLVSNVTSVARAVALSHAIGLNHDCSEWKIGDLEKRMRWKAWWGVLIHDRWFNFAQGTPPYISKGHYDVPLPTVDLLTRRRRRRHSTSTSGLSSTSPFTSTSTTSFTSTSPSTSTPSLTSTSTSPPFTSTSSGTSIRAAEVFIHFCRLTEIVGDVLPLIYHIRSGNDSFAAEQTSRSEIELNRWLESRPGWLSLTDYQSRPPVPGLLNLQLSYLAVRMLLRRIAWHEISQRESDPAPSWLLGCQAAAEDIVRFVTSLHRQDLHAFWLPYSAHHFTSAVTLLLRCALQTSHASVRVQCMSSARALVDCLRALYEHEKWDLAEIALPQSETVLKRIEDALPSTPLPTPANLHKAAPVHHMHASTTTRGYMDMDHTMLGGEPLPPDDDAFGTSSQNQGSLEELFPDIFSDFTDTALFSGQALLDFND